MGILLNLVIVALIEGVAEVLPLSASGHLALLGGLSGPADPKGPVIAAINLGIALALALYFWRDLVAMAAGVWRMTRGRSDPGARLFLRVMAGSIPTIVAGIFLARMGFGTPGVLSAAAALLVFGVFLWVADRLGMTVRRVEHLSWSGAFFIGILQIAALIPGVSRTGLTVTAARLMGYERTEAARFSLLLAIPVLLASSIFFLGKGEAGVAATREVIIAAAVAWAVALVTVAAMMGWLKRRSFVPFAVWRIVVGAGVLAWLILAR